VAANPMDLPIYTFNSTTQTYSISGYWDDETSIYPISNDLLPILKEQVKKELIYTMQIPMDTQLEANPNIKEIPQPK
jgi:hypothetical protein